MTNEHAYRMIGERVKELTRSPEVQRKMLDIAGRDGKEIAERYVYQLAIATLAGI